MNMWDERYSATEFAYGDQPNDFLVRMSPHLPPKAKILSLAEGEGRNAVFLARRGHDLTAVDGSAVGLEKATRLAQTNGVTLQTVVADLADFEIGQERWDAIVAIWCHLPSTLRRRVHRACVAGLKPGGIVVLESYRPQQLEYKTGGPSDPDFLPSLALLREEFAGLEFIHAVETERNVQEGRYHHGLSAVVQVYARKPL